MEEFELRIQIQDQLFYSGQTKYLEYHDGVIKNEDYTINHFERDLAAAAFIKDFVKYGQIVKNHEDLVDKMDYECMVITFSDKEYIEEMEFWINYPKPMIYFDFVFHIKDIDRLKRALMKVNPNRIDTIDWRFEDYIKNLNESIAKGEKTFEETKKFIITIYDFIKNMNADKDELEEVKKLLIENKYLDL